MQHCHSLLLKAFRLQNTMLEKSCSLYANAGLIAVTILKVCYAGGLMQSLTVTVWSILYYKIVIKIFWRCENIPIFDSESILGAWCSPYTLESIPVSVTADNRWFYERLPIVIMLLPPLLLIWNTAEANPPTCVLKLSHIKRLLILIWSTMNHRNANKFNQIPGKHKMDFSFWQVW